MFTGSLDQVFTRSDASGTRTPLTDALGSTLALTDAAGSVTTEYTYDPFGQTTVTGAANNHTNQYVGRENDGTGLYYYRARYYSPILQRFLSEDPLGFAAGDANLYAYVANSPINFTDPFGLSVWKNLIRVYTNLHSGPRLLGQISKGNKTKKLEAIERYLKKGRGSGAENGIVHVVNGTDAETETLAKALSPEGRARFDEAAGGFPEHYNPEGREVNIHVQRFPPGRLSGIAALLAPMSMELAGRSCTTNGQMLAAGLWDIASAIDPIFLTDALDWYFGLSGPAD
jgi:RHS repeat-associated protein